MQSCIAMGILHFDLLTLPNTMVGLSRLVPALVIFTSLSVLFLDSGSRSLQSCSNSGDAPRSTQGLAFAQSYGFFSGDDISDNDWKVYYQQPARKAIHYRFPNDKDKRSLEKPHEWIFHNWDPYFACPHVQKVGGLGGGPKWTCDLERLKTVVARRRLLAKSTTRAKNAADCLIYSIGSKGNYLWEDAIYDRLGPLCEIHVFDPGDYERPQMKERNMYFHKIGLGSSYSHKWMAKRRRQGEYLSFQSIQRLLGHENRTIDLFKIDCEGCEWHSYRDWIGADLRQIQIETHDLPTLEKEKRTDFGIFPQLSPSEFFDSFQNHGFVLFAKEVNTHNGLGRSSEWSFLKLHPSFLSDDASYAHS